MVPSVTTRFFTSSQCLPAGLSPSSPSVSCSISQRLSASLFYLLLFPRILSLPASVLPQLIGHWLFLLTDDVCKRFSLHLPLYLPVPPPVQGSLAQPAAVAPAWALHTGHFLLSPPFQRPHPHHTCARSWCLRPKQRVDPSELAHSSPRKPYTLPSAHKPPVSREHHLMSFLRVEWTPYT